MNVVGLMSGTSVDGIDAAFVSIEEDGDELRVRLLAYRETPHDEALRRRVHALFDPALSRIDETCEVNALLGESFAAAAHAVIDQAGLPADLVASHGQTVWHQVRDGAVTGTLQLAEPSVIAERLGVTVVADFRPRDVAAGGQGAPLASYPDVLLFSDPEKARAIQNLGGIANVTYLPPGGDPTAALAFDTGPSNVLIDHAVARLTGGAQTYDRDGAMAAAGRVDETLLAELLALPYFAAPPPKTTGRELFGAQLVEPLLGRVAPGLPPQGLRPHPDPLPEGEGTKSSLLPLGEGQDEGAAPSLAPSLTPNDLVATLTMLTVRSIADAYRRFLPRLPDEVVLGGGGAKNPTLRHWLADALGPTVRMLDHDDFGLPSTGREAIYFAVMGYQALQGRPNTVPACTGARHPVVMGKLVPGPNYGTLVRAIRPEVTIRRLRVEE